jgi:hypothetical protein
LDRPKSRSLCSETGIARSKKRVKDWTKADRENSTKAFAEVCRDLAGLLEQRLAADSDQVQGVIQRHHRWLKQFWTPTRERYTGHSQLIVDSELRKAYEAFHPQLPEFLAAAIKVFAQRELA